jgi:hypothetical protein
MMDINNLIPEKKSESEAYNLGYDCGRNGATESNCHFTIFSNPKNTKAWEKEKADGEKDK